MNSDILPTGPKKSFWQRFFVSKRNERDDTEENSPLLPKKEVSHGTTNTPGLTFFQVEKGYDLDDIKATIQSLKVQSGLWPEMDPTDSK